MTPKFAKNKIRLIAEKITKEMLYIAMLCDDKQRLTEQDSDNISSLIAVARKELKTLKKYNDLYDYLVDK